MNLDAPITQWNVRHYVSIILCLVTPFKYDNLMEESFEDLMYHYDRAFGGKKIQAIKHLRWVSDMRLKEAKEFIEREVIPHTPGWRRERLNRLRAEVQHAHAMGVHPTPQTLRAYLDALRDG